MEPTGLRSQLASLTWLDTKPFSLVAQSQTKLTFIVASVAQCVTSGFMFRSFFKFGFTSSNKPAIGINNTHGALTAELNAIKCVPSVQAQSTKRWHLNVSNSWMNPLCLLHQPVMFINSCSLICRFDLI